MDRVPGRTTLPSAARNPWPRQLAHPCNVRAALRWSQPRPFANGDASGSAAAFTKFGALDVRVDEWRATQNRARFSDDVNAPTRLIRRLCRRPVRQASGWFLMSRASSRCRQEPRAASLMCAHRIARAQSRRVQAACHRFARSGTRSAPQLDAALYRDDSRDDRRAVFCSVYVGEGSERDDDAHQAGDTGTGNSAAQLRP